MRVNINCIENSLLNLYSVFYMCMVLAQRANGGGATLALWDSYLLHVGQRKRVHLCGYGLVAQRRGRIARPVEFINLA